MSLVDIENLKAGGILNEDVRDINGRLVLSKGQTIEANHIRILKIWGVSQVSIDQDFQTADENQDAGNMEKLRRTENTVRAVMQNVDISHPGINELFQVAVEYRYQNDLIIDFEPKRPLPESLKLDLSGGIKAQIEYSDINLPETPEILIAFNKVLENPMASVDDIADVVNKSPSLAALLLKIANSAFYGFPTRIDTISRAVSLIGTREISSLVMGISTMRLFRQIPGDLVDMAAFLRHSLACGLLARILAAQKNLYHTERLFVAGLLHDIGRLVWFVYFSEQAKLLLNLAQKTGRCLYDIEKVCLGISHEQIAEQLFAKWDFPVSLKNSVVFHHTPSQSFDQMEAGILHVANAAINAIGMGHSGERIIPRFETESWDSLQIATGAFRTAINQAIQQLDIMEALFTEF